MTVSETQVRATTTPPVHQQMADINQNPSEKEFQIVRFKPPPNFKLPDGWVVEEKPRPANSSKRRDRYYYEPGTGRQFRSLISVQKYLTEEAKDNSGVKSGNGKRSACGVRSPGKSATKRSSVAKEEGFTSKTLNFSVQSTPTKTDSQRKEDRGGSTHNLSRPPEKVSWVLSGPGGYWNPFVDDTIVPESEMLKWSEAFGQSIHGGVNN
ncbi:methyl-CpG-binding domain-containing protein 7-like isoform X2 [Lotus japonicus]|nr:methyl-CpG-binding domain-containing protein 7-like isoform X2 [Lotus japonicus]